MDINALNTLDQLQIAIAFILYAFVFGWIGYRRGQTREAWVFAVATVSLIVLRLRGDIFVGIANLGWQLINMLSGGAFQRGIHAGPDHPVSEPADGPGHRV